MVCECHKDCKNLATGLCCVIPFGSFDPSVEGHLVIEELNMEFEVAPGVPIFFPSALYTHYNTELINYGVRGSFVAWTSGMIFQYVDLNFRAVKDLSKQEEKDYRVSVKARIDAGLALLMS
ncbi:hypothetical protein PUNSTDRAFT_73904 [Punctularia strigosozonata HHB-11173 SS5]|uniref:uncharacterized protein n=1 Tax=Punctularia strigosozonata (strain HHB-11173) TaxID=741275 RepID=UPI0004416715|nr:uncharacterized protein PUNSTDRAFT_73904 [Punctularia strigosozonata HHB-11173 SS5]EIN05705.1 hypothetical protein PUNSTDRAFT_73904 [Punctularia strigosozonata HHB-11173 SS5]